MEIINTILEKDIDLSIFEPYKINCGECCGLCCVALYFSKSDGFPKNKEAGTACKNLEPDYRCKVHGSLSQQGLKGCTAYNCFGAGSYVTRQLKSLPDWQAISQEEAGEIFSSYLVVLNVHQTLWYLSQCLTLQLPQAEKEQAESLIKEGQALTEQSLEVLAVLNPKSFCEKSNKYLKHICETYQTCFSNSCRTQTSSPMAYIGKNMKRKNLSGNDFSMFLLIAANLEGADVRGANFLGADMRDTNVCNTDLSQCLFLTQIQINSAKGNSNTVLPPYLHRPHTWKYN